MNVFGEAVSYLDNNTIINSIQIFIPNALIFCHIGSANWYLIWILKSQQQKWMINDKMVEKNKRWKLMDHS